MLLPQRGILKAEIMQPKAIYLQLLLKKMRKFIRSELGCHYILSQCDTFRVVHLMGDRFKKTLVNLRDNLDGLVWNTWMIRCLIIGGLTEAVPCKSLTLIA